jgi:hypothetical protein
LKENLKKTSFIMISKIVKSILFIIFTINLMSAQTTPRVFYLGHSLVNFDIPNMVDKLTQDAGLNLYYQANIGIGANLSWHWTQPRTGEGDYWDTTLRNQVFDKFIITEAIALKSQLMWSNTYDYLDSFYDYAARRSPAVKMYIYETWHCINSGTPTKCMFDEDSHIAWRNRLDLDRPLWEGIADHLNKRVPNTAFMIPGGQAMAKLHDAIQAGKLAGFSSSRSLFQDDIHLTNIGNYYIACVMYSVIHQRSAEGLKNRLEDNWGQLYSVYPTAEQARVLQKLAWETVCAYARTGVKCATDIIESKDQIDDEFIIQNEEIISLNHHEYQSIKLMDIYGKTVSLTSHKDRIKYKNLPSGIYLLYLEYNGSKRLKKLQL